MRCDARGAMAGRISSVKRAIDDRTPAVFTVWCSSPKATTPVALPMNALIAPAGETNRSATSGPSGSIGGGRCGEASSEASPASAAAFTGRRA